jgi:hypothetical protein
VTVFLLLNIHGHKCNRQYNHVFNPNILCAACLIFVMSRCTYVLLHSEIGGRFALPSCQYSFVQLVKSIFIYNLTLSFADQSIFIYNLTLSFANCCITTPDLIQP